MFPFQLSTKETTIRVQRKERERCDIPASTVSVQNTGTPYFAENDFWRQVLRGPAQRPGPAFYPLGKSKVCHLEVKSIHRYTKYRSSVDLSRNISQRSITYLFVCVAAHLNVAVVVNEKVLGFQISVYEI